MTPHRRDRQGVSAVEAALAFPVLFVMLFAVMDWSWYLHHLLTVSRSAHAGVRLAAGVATAADPEGVAIEETRRWLEDQAFLAAHDGVTAQLIDDVLFVRVDVPFAPMVGLVPTPERLVGTAQTAWYGDVFDED